MRELIASVVEQGGITTDYTYDLLKQITQVSRPTVRNTPNAVFIPEIFNIGCHSGGTASRFAKSITSKR